MSLQAKPEERRIDRRFTFAQKVYWQETDEFIGFAENISLTGLMLVTKQPIDNLQELSIWFGVDKDEKMLNRIFVSAYRVWQSFTDDGPKLHCYGLHLGNLNEDSKKKIEALLDKLAG